MRSLVWFRNDLRVDDNPALTAAVEAAGSESERGGVAGLFLVSREQWKRHDWGRPKIDFVMANVRKLSERLGDPGIPLVVVDAGDFAAAADRVAEVAEALGADTVFANMEYEVNERARDRRVGARLAEDGRELELFHDQTVVPPGRVRTGKGDFYSVFTPFFRSWLRELEENELPMPRDAPEAIENPVKLPGELAGRADLEIDEGVPHEGPDDRFPAGEDAARERLERFIEENAGGYHRDRDLAAADATSRLSPYLAVGSLSIRRCLEAALAANDGRLSGGRKGVDTWIKELAWREFYRHVLVGFPRVSKNRAFRPETEALAWRDDDESFEAWCAGRTGVPLVDAGIRQLLATGWMHNRLRMVTAMFLTKNLLIDWRRGERFFNRHLVDADLASNNGGWQWSASTGTDAAPYFRIFNPWTQAKRYDPDGDFIRRFVPELAEVPPEDLHDPERLREHLSASRYPAPIVDLPASRERALAAFAALPERS